MTSPDVSKYVDLTVYDEKASTSLQTILQAARAFVPGWVPDTGQIEVALAEAIARRSSEVVHSISYSASQEAWVYKLQLQSK